MRVHRFALTTAAAMLLLLSASPAFGVPAEETAPELAYSGAWYSWSSADLSGGAYRYTNAPGAAVTVAFDGEGITLVARKGPEFGIASVSIDGGIPEAVDLYSEETTTQKIAFSATGLPASEHTARIAWTGTRNAASVGTYINVDAVEIVGTGLVYPFVRFEEQSAPFAFEGLWSVWSSPLLSGGGYAFGDHPSSACNIAFDGTSLSLLARTGPEFGIASVSIDGGVPVDMDLYSATTAFQAVKFTTGDLAARPHVVRVEHTGRKNAASTGTYISIDAADIRGAAAAEPVGPTLVESDDPRVSYSGAWRTYSATALSGGSYRYTGSPGGSVAFTFDGTRLDLIGRVGPEFGIAYVSVDGGPARKVDLYCAETRYQQVVYSTWDLSSGPHVVRM